MFQILSNFQCVDEIVQHFAIHQNQLTVMGRTYFDSENQIEFFGTGSAWNDPELALVKCQAECIERWALDVYQKKNPFSMSSQAAGPQSMNKVLSVSNGVAFSQSPILASQSARHELIERHCLLHSWYFSENSPLLYRTENFHADQKDFQFDDYVIAETQDGLFVGVSCLFHRSSLLHFGFGTASNLEELYQKSRSEALQRHLFLGEEYSADLSFQASPMFHQEYYCQPWNKEIFLKWFHRKPILLQPVIDASLFQEDILWDHEDGRVVRATHPDLIHLFFGKPDFLVDPGVPSIFHPMA